MKKLAISYQLSAFRRQLSDVSLQMSCSRQRGQIVIVLLLLMLVALSVGLAYTQRSLTDVTNSTQVEQSSRAFSAAEAGIQKALVSPAPSALLALDNNSSAVVNSSGLMPYTNSTVGIEYPPIGRETTAQFWFVNPSLATPVNFYNSGKFDLYFGNESTTDKPAVEVQVVMLSNGQFYTKTYYYDSDATRANTNKFAAVSGCGSTVPITTILGSNRAFYCKQTVPTASTDIPDLGSTPPVRICPNATAPYNCTLILARVRFLYINENHKMALAPVGANVTFPPQVQIYNALGTSGQSQKQIQAFKVKDVILPWFDFALFSVNEIRK